MASARCYRNTGCRNIGFRNSGLPEPASNDVHTTWLTVGEKKTSCISLDSTDVTHADTNISRKSVRRFSHNIVSYLVYTVGLYVFLLVCLTFARPYPTLLSRISIVTQILRNATLDATSKKLRCRRQYWHFYTDRISRTFYRHNSHRDRRTGGGRWGSFPHKFPSGSSTLEQGIDPPVFGFAPPVWRDATKTATTNNIGSLYRSKCLRISNFACTRDAWNVHVQKFHKLTGRSNRDYITSKICSARLTEIIQPLMARVRYS